MTNREKLLKTNIYDLLCTIQKAYTIQALLEDDGKISGVCVIENIEKKPRPCSEDGICSMCIANWLNQEADPPKPQWQRSLMMNFLRRVEDAGT